MKWACGEDERVKGLNLYEIGADKLFDRLAFCLEAGLQELRTGGNRIATGRCRRDGNWYFTVGWKEADASEPVLAHLAKALTGFLTSDWEREQIRKQIAREYTYYDLDEVEYITEKAVKWLATYKRPGESVSRKKEIEREVLRCLKEQPVLNLEGLSRFRLRKFESDFAYAVEQAVDEYLMDREYQEFVKLLRHFLAMQKPRAALIHLLVDAAGNRLANQNGTPITNEELEGFAAGLKEINLQQDDTIISVLIALAPVRLKIHVKDFSFEGNTLVETVKRIFDERSCLCTGCALCQNPLEYWNPNNHLPLDYLK